MTTHNGAAEPYDLAKDPREKNKLAAGQTELVQRAEALMKASFELIPMSQQTSR